MRKATITIATALASLAVASSAYGAASWSVITKYPYSKVTHTHRMHSNAASWSGTKFSVNLRKVK